MDRHLHQPFARGDLSRSCQQRHLAIVSPQASEAVSALKLIEDFDEAMVDRRNYEYCVD
jgi:hypothetical protein